MLGKQEGVSTLMLSVKNCFNNGTLARGFMRILGFTYESNRADRDQFLTFNWDNVAEGEKCKCQHRSTIRLCVGVFFAK